jgi:hypothetical protein
VNSSKEQHLFAVHRVKSPSHRAAFETTLQCCGTVKRYVIDPEPRSGWCCEIWRDSIRVTAVAAEGAAAIHCYDACRQEIEGLLSEGWHITSDLIGANVPL